jgi:hypothetical protein
MPRPARGRAARRVIGARSRATIVLSILLVLLGITLIVETAIVGGNVGYVLGVLLALAGGLRLYLSSR